MARTRASLLPLLLILLLCTIASSSLLSSSSPSPYNATLQDDAPWYSARDPTEYLETWYYNFFDFDNTFGGTIVFSIDGSTPTYRLDLRLVISDHVLRYTNAFNGSAVEFSSLNASLRFGPNFVVVQDTDHYWLHINMSNDTSRAVLDLTFARVSGIAPIFGWRNASAASGLPFSWLSFLPSAYVSGTVHYKARNSFQQDIDGTGYHDHWSWYSPNSWKWLNLATPTSHLIAFQFLSADLGFACFTPDTTHRSCFNSSDFIFQEQWTPEGLPDGGILKLQDGSVFSFTPYLTIPIFPPSFYEQLDFISGPNNITGMAFVDFMRPH